MDLFIFCLFYYKTLQFQEYDEKKIKCKNVYSLMFQVLYFMRILFLDDIRKSQHFPL